MDFERYVLAVRSRFVSVCTGSKHFWRVWLFSFACVVIVGIGYLYVFSPPKDFPAGSMVSIARGESLQDLSAQFAKTHLIAHPRLFRLILRISGQSTNIQAGAYLFSAPENMLTIAYRIVSGAYGIPPARITFPEGETARDAAARVEEAFPQIPTADFISKAQPYEGYLFPDTYLLSPSSNAESIVAMMRANFDTKIAPLLPEVSASGHSFSDIVIMASVIEREARSVANKRIVAGILWDRIKLGMALQVDAVFGYIYGRDTYSPSFADLKIDSPYNTYLHKGLPPGPISNPGLESIDAAIHPTKTEYLYYLTGRDGLMHYASTYAGHQSNQKKYLP